MVFTEVRVVTPDKGQVVVQVVKNSPANSGDMRDEGSIPGLGRSPRGRHGNPLQYSFLENPMDRGAWRAKSQTGLSDLAHIHTHTSINR